MHLYDHIGTCEIEQIDGRYTLRINGKNLWKPEFNQLSGNSWIHESTQPFQLIDSIEIKVSQIGAFIKIEEKNKIDPNKANIYIIDAREGSYYVYERLYMKEICQILEDTHFEEGPPEVICYNDYGIVAFPQKPENEKEQRLYYRSLRGQGGLQPVFASPIGGRKQDTTLAISLENGKRLPVSLTRDGKYTIQDTDTIPINIPMMTQQY